MALPASGPLNLSQIVAEFGGTAPHWLSEYYGAAAGLPASGPMSMSEFYGLSSAVVTSLTVANATGYPLRTEDDKYSNAGWTYLKGWVSGQHGAIGTTNIFGTAITGVVATGFDSDDTDPPDSGLLEIRTGSIQDAATLAVAVSSVDVPGVGVVSGLVQNLAAVQATMTIAQVIALASGTITFNAA